MHQCDHSQQTLLTPHGAADLRNGEFSCKCRTDGNWCDKISSKFEQCSLNSVFSGRTGDDAVLWSLCNNGGWVKMNRISKSQQRRKQTVSPAASRRDSSTWSLEVQRIPWESKIETCNVFFGQWLVRCRRFNIVAPLLIFSINSVTNVGQRIAGRYDLRVKPNNIRWWPKVQKAQPTWAPATSSCSSSLGIGHWLRGRTTWWKNQMGKRWPCLLLHCWIQK